MKRLAILAILFWVAGPLPANADTSPDKPFSLALVGGARTFSGGVYDSINPAFNLELGFETTWSLMVFVQAGYVSASGELSYTREPTTLVMVPLEAGIRYLVDAGRIAPYFGGGIGFYIMQEDNNIGTVSGSGLGFFGEGGMRINLATAFFLDVRAKYTALSIRIQDTSFNLGGFSLLVGIGFLF